MPGRNLLPYFGCIAVQCRPVRPPSAVCAPRGHTNCRERRPTRSRGLRAAADVTGKGVQRARDAAVDGNAEAGDAPGLSFALLLLSVLRFAPAGATSGPVASVRQRLRTPLSAVVLIRLSAAQSWSGALLLNRPLCTYGSRTRLRRCGPGDARSSPDGRNVQGGALAAAVGPDRGQKKGTVQSLGLVAGCWCRRCCAWFAPGSGNSAVALRRGRR